MSAVSKACVGNLHYPSLGPVFFVFKSEHNFGILQWMNRIVTILILTTGHSFSITLIWSQVNILHLFHQVHFLI